MNHDDTKKLVKLLAGLFPNQLTVEQGRFAAEKFREFECADVERAIKTHRESGATKEGFIDWKNLFEGCRAASKSRSEGEENFRREGTWADVYRRQRQELADAGDYEVVLRVHRRWWWRCGKRDSYRSQITASCVTRLIVFGMSQADAEKWTEVVFDDSPDYFRQCLEEIRDAAAQPEQGLLV